MAWPSVPKGFLGARRYSAHFNYPLSAYEQWFWQVETRLPKPKTSRPVNRSRREKISFQKHTYLQSILPLLASNPFVLAVYITGSLAMNNCKTNDDIDLMFIVRPNSLWLARMVNLIVLQRYNLRRPANLPEHRSPAVKDKICDNLYLEDLKITSHNLYLAHEILQAKPVHDPYNTRRLFLLQNAWVKTFLPVAYRETLKRLPKNSSIPKTGLLVFWILGFLNLFAFFFQYAYMASKITKEKVSLRQAFFHPNQIVV